ncbi:hypothetical protein KJY77_02210 [Canibacter sp. lx-72]|uniref:hypothetical protein n=1 Tax=Canibacter zhuwentaonis TaxID=2837491 RepID=UPI001BDC1476|nr:hypothetical protein [Canibacter zhuwentaonis]MBT1017957.1 hypothetical protein [Canibacter zhuwentaonis]MBT1035117.1 hypothetical protein [Canibacter zhuwentaonis]
MKKDSKNVFTPQKIIVTVLTALLLVGYLYATTTGVGNLVGMIRIAASLGTTVSAAGWVLLLLAVALPLIIAAGVTLYARAVKPRWFVYPVLLCCGLAGFSCLQIELLYLVPQGLYLSPVTAS